MIEDRARVAVAAPAASGFSVDGLFRFLHVDRTRGIALANLGLVFALILNGVVGLLLFGDPAGVLLLSVPFGGFFYIMARKLSEGETPSDRALRLSGFMALLLVPLSISSLFESLKAPVDVGCVFAASGFSVAFGWAALYQLRRSGALRLW